MRRSAVESINLSAINGCVLSSEPWSTILPLSSTKVLFNPITTSNVCPASAEAGPQSNTPRHLSLECNGTKDHVSTLEEVVALCPVFQLCER